MAGRQAQRIARATARYAQDLPRVQAATEAYVALVTQLLDDAGINYLAVTGRAKTVESYAGKAARRVAGRLVHPRPETDITDQVGVRVVTYVLSDVAAVAQLLADQLQLLEDRDMGQETAAEGRFGYSSRHLTVQLDPAREGAGGPMAGRTASVQVRTVLQHAWAEFEHDIRYKGSVPEQHGPDLDRRFTLAAGLLELADQEFSTIRERLREGTEPAAAQDEDDPRISGQDLAAFLAGQFTDAGWSRTDHYSWVSGLLLELGVTSLAELREVLRGVDHAAIEQHMAYHYPPGAVRRLDDALLWSFGERYVALHGNSHRRPLLAARLERLLAPPAPRGT
ncbi:GTP pyrophosphokinase [Arsenicicoccus sp. oral taxon 190]|uniref:GTP pyrophosphokinase n=1 Tax=Arsenicicoccus sp. oral taxon 190 TaxID=1658671 RepID=UPI00067A0D78|nr:GTP pyrophosphokinase [Arsenicicoccus sp. oral taxon 190]AKT50615.1 GTP pyrophosphokinase [Arsenicicoccus sp. oral taxon 190]